MLPVPRTWSDVTPSWMTAALSTRLPGTVVGEVDIGEVEDGTNTRARVGLSYARGMGPRSVFVKCPGRVSNRLALLALRALATEARLAASGVRLPLEHPLPFAGGVEWSRLATVVVMDDVVAAGGQSNDAVTPLGVDDVRSGLEGLARLHAAYWERRLPAPLRFLQPWRLGWTWALVSAASLARGRRRLSEVEPSLVMPRQAGARSLARQFAQSARLAASGAQTLLHGDPHPANSYTQQGRTGFYDWQLARIGHWSHDVGYFLAGSLEAGDRRAHERELLEGYLDALGRAGGDPPSPDVAWARYRATPAFGLATWMHTLSFGTFQPVGACVAMVRRFAAAYDDLETWRSAAVPGG